MSAATVENPAPSADFYPFAFDQNVTAMRQETILRFEKHDRERNQLSARAVHASVTALSGYCGLIVDGPLGVFETQREVLQCMQSSIRRSSRMASAMSAVTWAGEDG